jgi:hypothetical protein
MTTSINRFALVAIGVVFVLSGCRAFNSGTSASQEVKQTTVSNVSRGQTLFLSHCVDCHQGVGNPPGPNAIITNSEQLNTEGRFRQLLRQPLSPSMRSFSEEDIDNESVHILYTYLISTRTHKG